MFCCCCCCDVLLLLWCFAVAVMFCCCCDALNSPWCRAASCWTSSWSPYIHSTLTFPPRAAQSVVPCRFLLDKQPLTFITRSRFHHVLHSPWCRAASCWTSSWSATTLNTPLHSLHAHVSITCCTVRGAVPHPVRQAAGQHDSEYPLTFITRSRFPSRAAQSVVPCRFRSDKQLVSHDTHNNTYNYKYTFSVEIAPVCKVSILVKPIGYRGSSGI